MKTSIQTLTIGWLVISALLFRDEVRAAVIVTQGLSPGATTWPGTPLITTVASPASDTVGESFNGGGGNASLSQTFTITTTNYLLQTIDIYVNGGSGGSVTSESLRSRRSNRAQSQFIHRQLQSPRCRRRSAHHLHHASRQRPPIRVHRRGPGVSPSRPYLCFRADGRVQFATRFLGARQRRYLLRRYRLSQRILAQRRGYPRLFPCRLRQCHVAIPAAHRHPMHRGLEHRIPKN